MAPEQAGGAEAHRAGGRRLRPGGDPVRDAHRPAAVQGRDARWTPFCRCYPEEPVPPSRLQPRVPRNLETICLKCLRKEPTGAIPALEELAEDLRRFLSHEPIHARPVSSAERLLKWCRRRPTAAAFLGTGLLTAILSLGVIIGMHVSERRRLDALRLEVQPWLVAGQAALARQDWKEARYQGARAVSRLAVETDLADLRSQADSLHQEASRQDDGRALSQRARHTFDDALFLIKGTQLSSVNLVANLEAGRAGALEMLELVGLTGPGATALNPLFTAEQKAQVLDSCCVLLLVLTQEMVERAAGSGQRFPREALALLDRLAPLDPPLRAFHRRAPTTWPRSATRPAPKRPPAGRGAFGPRSRFFCGGRRAVSARSAGVSGPCVSAGHATDRRLLGAVLPCRLFVAPAAAQRGHCPSDYLPGSTTWLLLGPAASGRGLSRSGTIRCRRSRFSEGPGGAARSRCPICPAREPRGGPVGSKGPG